MSYLWMYIATSNWRMPCGHRWPTPSRTSLRMARHLSYATNLQAMRGSRPSWHSCCWSFHQWRPSQLWKLCGQPRNYSRDENSHFCHHIPSEPFCCTSYSCCCTTYPWASLCLHHLPSKMSSLSACKALGSHVSYPLPPSQMQPQNLKRLPLHLTSWERSLPPAFKR